MKILTIDIETTGLPPKGKDVHYETDFNDYPRIVTIAWKVNDEPTVEYLINVEGFKIPKEATEIHGVTNEMSAASEHKIGDILGMLIKAGEGSDKVVGHNIYFDTSTIKANALRINGGDIEAEMVKGIYDILHKDKRIDTMRSTIKFCNLPGRYGKQKKWPKLEELHSKLFNESFDSHNAKDDVDAAYRCLKKLVELKVIEL